MSRGTRKSGFWLSFSTVECSCGEERIRAVVCPTCGHRPPAHEINILVQRRQRIGRELRAVEPGPLVEFTTAGVGVFAEVFADVDDWMSDFWTALDRYEDGVEDARILTARLFGVGSVVRERGASTSLARALSAHW
jgi:ribosomal protein L32